MTLEGRDRQSHFHIIPKQQKSINVVMNFAWAQSRTMQLFRCVSVISDPFLIQFAICNNPEQTHSTWPSHSVSQILLLWHDQNYEVGNITVTKTPWLYLPVFHCVFLWNRNQIWWWRRGCPWMVRQGQAFFARAFPKCEFWDSLLLSAFLTPRPNYSVLLVIYQEVHLQPRSCFSVTLLYGWQSENLAEYGCHGLPWQKTQPL